MKVAVPSEKKNELEEYVVAEHFGRCPYFVVATIENEDLVDKKVIENPHYKQHTPFAVPNFLAGIEPKPDIIITGGLGPRAISALEKKGIKVISGASGKVDKILEQYVKKELESSKNSCAHF